MENIFYHNIQFAYKIAINFILEDTDLTTFNVKYFFENNNKLKEKMSKVCIKIITITFQNYFLAQNNNNKYSAHTHFSFEPFTNLHNVKLFIIK